MVFMSSVQFQRFVQSVIHLSVEYLIEAVLAAHLDPTPY